MTISELTGTIKNLLIEKNKTRKQLYEAQKNFIKRYNKAFGTNYYQNFPWTNLNYENIKYYVHIVEFLLKSHSVVNGNPTRGISREKLIDKFNVNPSLLDKRNKFSPMSIGIVTIMHYSGRNSYYIKDMEKAKLWLKFIKELA